MMSAKLRLPGDTPNFSLDDTVASMLDALGLTKCADTYIGSVRVKGVSGGEKKRCARGAIYPRCEAMHAAWANGGAAWPRFTYESGPRAALTRRGPELPQSSLRDRVVCGERDSLLERESRRESATASGASVRRHV